MWTWASTWTWTRIYMYGTKTQRIEINCAVIIILKNIYKIQVYKTDQTVQYTVPIKKKNLRNSGFRTRDAVKFRETCIRNSVPREFRGHLLQLLSFKQATRVPRHTGVTSANVFVLSDRQHSYRKDSMHVVQADCISRQFVYTQA